MKKISCRRNTRNVHIHQDRVIISGVTKQDWFLLMAKGTDFETRGDGRVAVIKYDRNGGRENAIKLASEVFFYEMA